MSQTNGLLRLVAVRILDERSIERIIDPLLADLALEYGDAIRSGSAWKGRWVLIRGYSTFLKTITLCQAERLLPSSRAWTIDDRDALSRTAAFSAAAGVVATLALLVPPVTRVAVPHVRTLIFVVPQAIVLAVPIGSTFGVLLGLRGRTLSARSTRALFACAIVCSCLCLAALAWVVPLANQEFRQVVFGSSDGSPNVVEGLNELTLGELSERLSSFRRIGFTDWDARMLAYTYHMRWAVSCATLVLVLFAMAMRHRLLARWAVAVAAVAVCFSYYVLMWVGRAGALQEALPAFAGAWLPNAAFALAWLGLTALAAPRQRAQPEGRI